MRKAELRDGFSVHFVFLELEHFDHIPTERDGGLKAREVIAWRKSSQRWRYWSSNDIRIYLLEELSWRLAE